MLLKQRLSRNEDESWTVEAPVLPGCITWGATRAEAAVMAEDAVQGWLVTALRFGDEIPTIDGNALGYSIRRPILSEHRASSFSLSVQTHLVTAAAPAASRFCAR